MRDRPRDITFDDLEFRPQASNDDKTSALWVPYLQGDSVYDMLDEWTGDPLRWKDHYEIVEIDGVLMVKCWISLRSDDGEWVPKEDIGAFSRDDGRKESPTNARKGGISDAFKRCASRHWGVGRGVYQLGPVWAPCRSTNNGKQIHPTDATMPAIMREYAKLDLSFELTGGGARAKFAAGSGDGSADENPFPPEHQSRPPQSSRSVSGARPKRDAHTPTPSTVFAGLTPDARKEAMEALQGVAEQMDKEPGEKLKGGGYWPMMTPAQAEANPERAAEIVEFMTGEKAPA